MIPKHGPGIRKLVRSWGLIHAQAVDSVGGPDTFSKVIPRRADLSTAIPKTIIRNYKMIS